MAVELDNLYQTEYSDEVMDAYLLELFQQHFGYGPTPENDMTLEKADYVCSRIAYYSDRVQEAQRVKDLKLSLLQQAMNIKREKIEVEYRLQADPWVNEIKRYWKIFGQSLQDFVFNRLRDGKQKSEKIAGVQIGSRTNPEGLYLKDSVQLKRWALENKLAVKIKLPVGLVAASMDEVEALALMADAKDPTDVLELPHFNDIKNHWKTTGEIPAGTHKKNKEEVGVVKFNGQNLLEIIGEKVNDESEQNHDESSGDELSGV
jgi:hypothetical protein